MSGQTIDSNAGYLARQLFEVNIPVASKYTVGDDINAIHKMLRSASEDAQIILLTGGLGPTEDDLTRFALAEFFDTDLVLNESSLNEIELFFEELGKPMPLKNKIQAKLPKNTQPLKNKYGTAPGILKRSDDRVIAAFPGVPSEMKPMFEENVLPVIKEMSGQQAIVIEKLKCIGIGESSLAEILGDMMIRHRNPLINCTVSGGIITLHVIASGTDRQQACEKATQTVAQLKHKLGELVFGHDDQTLQQVVGQLLGKKGYTLALAESCTGGLIASMITEVPGSSRYFKQSWVTYSNESKVQQLGVPADIIKKYGAVSEQTAIEMSRGARKKSGADYALSVTGIAGPSGGTEQKPVGTVFISLSSSDKEITKKYEFKRDRRYVRIRTALTALNMLRLNLAD